MARHVTPSSRKAFAIDFFRDRSLSSERFNELAAKTVPFQRRLLEQLGFASNALVGNPFPSSWQAMRAPVLGNILDKLDPSIAWAIAKLTAHRIRLNDALVLRRQMELSLIAGRPTECESLIESFESQFGCSLWSLDIRFASAQFSRGYHGNRTALSYFFDSCDNEWIRLLAHNCSFRALLHISTQEYLEAVGMMVPQVYSDDLSAYALDYLRYRLCDEVPTTDSAVCNVLHFESRHSIIDLYDTTRNILSHLLRTPINIPVQQAVVHLARDICHDRLAGLAAVATDGVKCDSSGGTVLYECLDRLSQCDYRGCLTLSLNELVRDPAEFIWYDLVSISAVSSQDPLPCSSVFPDEAPAQRVLSSLYDWYSARIFRRQALEDLRRLARTLRPTRLGGALAEFVALFDQQKSPLGRDCVGLLACSVPIPHFAYGYTQTDRAAAYLDHFHSHAEQTAGYAAVSSYFQLLGVPHRGSPANLPEPETLRFTSAAAYTRRSWQEVVDALRQLRTIAPEHAKIHPELLVCESVALLEMRELDHAANVLSKLYCEDRKLLPPVLLRRMAEILKDSKFRPANTSIAWAVLAIAANNDDRMHLPHDRVHDFVNDYIESQGATKPTDLLKDSTEPTIEVCVFLTECCTPDILESSMWFCSREELLKDRLEVCDWLIANAKFREVEIQREVASLTRQLAILDLTSQIQRSRIFIDTDAILKNLDEITWSQTNSLLTVRALKSHELRRGLKLLSMPNPEGSRVTVVLVDEGKVCFEQIFDTIKQQFLNSPELGLDANLSQRVRHGTLAGELRAIFDRLHLSTKTRSDGSYEPNVHWCEALRASSGSRLFDELNVVFREFSRKLDEQIRAVREEWIQIQTEAKPDGLFEYTFSSREIESLLKSISPLAEHRDVHELIIEALLARTETCLARVRSAIASRLSPGIEQLLDELVFGVEKSMKSDCGSLASLRTTVTQCKTEFSRQLETIQGWFYVDNRHEQNAFRLPDLVHSVVGMLRRISTPCKVAITNSSREMNAVQGLYFRPLWDLLVILFDNASRHSGLSEVDIQVEFELLPDYTRFVCINEMAEECSGKDLSEKVEQLNRLSLSNASDLSKLREEGGSGTAKLHKIVRHELGRDKYDHSIHFNVTADGRFEVQIEIGIGLSNEHALD